MPQEPLDHVLHYIRRVAGAPGDGEPPDPELLHRFTTRRDEAAFATLVQRHGPLVWGVCRRVLAQTQDAEDAFQATFLVLARKAGAVHWRRDVANWLYAVALRVALKARSEAARRRWQERQIAAMAPPEQQADAGADEVRPVLDEELRRLPCKYRAPLVLHYFEGQTYAEAARVLGVPAGTVSARLARARAMLRRRLTRRGLSLSGAGLAAVLAETSASAGVPAAVVDATVRGAVLVATGMAPAGGVISAPAARLMEGVLQAMFQTKVQIGAGLVLGLVLMTAGAGVLSHHLQAAAQDDGRPPVRRAAAGDEQGDTLRQELQRLRQENERLAKAVQELRDTVRRLEQKVAPAGQGTGVVRYRGKPASYWLEQLRDRDPVYRQGAVDALGAMAEEDHSVIPALVAALDDRVGPVRYAAMRALSGVAKEAMPALLPMLQSSRRSDRLRAAQGLFYFGAEGKPAIRPLLRLLGDKDAEVRAAVVETLGNVASPDTAVIPPLVRALGDESDDVRGRAVNALATFRGRAVPALLQALTSKTTMVRAGAAEALGFLATNPKPFLPALVEALADPSPDVQQATGRTLYRLGEAAVPALSTALKSPKARVRLQAAEILSRMDRQTGRAALPALLKALGDDDADVRKAARKAYRSINPDANLPGEN
jgi:RNA polymerase sigma factor (sigma-70 family)